MSRTDSDATLITMADKRTALDYQTHYMIGGGRARVILHALSLQVMGFGTATTRYGALRNPLAGSTPPFGAPCTNFFNTLDRKLRQQR